MYQCEFHFKFVICMKLLCVVNADWLSVVLVAVKMIDKIMLCYDLDLVYLHELRK